MLHLKRVVWRLLPAVASATIVIAAPARGQVSWTDWTGTGTNTATGTLLFGATPVGVTYSGPYAFVQTGCGTNFWVPNVYTSATVPNPPTACDIVALSAGGSKSITFSQPVTNPLFAFLSWNGQGGNPGTPVPFTGLNGATPVVPQLQLLSQGTSFWGAGTASVSGNNLLVQGEVGGTVQLLGTFTQIDFTDNSEFWHGFTVGATGLAGPGGPTVPEPSTVVLLASGLLALGGAVWRRTRTMAS